LHTTPGEAWHATFFASRARNFKEQSRSSLRDESPQTTHQTTKNPCAGREDLAPVWSGVAWECPEGRTTSRPGSYRSDR